MKVTQTHAWHYYMLFGPYGIENSFSCLKWFGYIHYYIITSCSFYLIPLAVITVFVPFHYFKWLTSVLKTPPYQMHTFQSCTLHGMHGHHISVPYLRSTWLRYNDFTSLTSYTLPCFWALIPRIIPCYRLHYRLKGHLTSFQRALFGFAFWTGCRFYW